MAKLYLGTREVTPAITVSDSEPITDISKANYLVKTDGTVELLQTVHSLGYQPPLYPLPLFETDLKYQNGLDYRQTYMGDTTIQRVNLTAITDISGAEGLGTAFDGTTCEIDLSSLKRITGTSALSNLFYGRSDLINYSFDSLEDVSGSRCLQGCFITCTSIENIYFPALKTTSFGSYTDQFTSLLYRSGSSVTHTIHFPSNLESTISQLDGYPKFGRNSDNVVLAFDLPATS